MVLNGSDFPHWQAQLASDLIKENYIVSFPAFLQEIIQT